MKKKIIKSTIYLKKQKTTNVFLNCKNIFQSYNERLLEFYKNMCSDIVPSINTHQAKMQLHVSSVLKIANRLSPVRVKKDG